MTSITKDERYEITGYIRYIKFSGDYNKFDSWKEEKKSIFRQEHLKIPGKRGRYFNIRRSRKWSRKKLRSMKGTPRHGISLS